MSGLMSSWARARSSRRSEIFGGCSVTPGIVSIRNVARRGYMLVPDGPSTPQIVAADRPRQHSLPSMRPRPPASEQAAPAAARSRSNWLVAVPILAVVGIVGVSFMFSRSEEQVENAPAALKAPLARDIPLASLVMLPFAVEVASGDGDWSADACSMTLPMRSHESRGLRWWRTPRRDLQR